VVLDWRDRLARELGDGDRQRARGIRRARSTPARASATPAYHGPDGHPVARVDSPSRAFAVVLRAPQLLTGGRKDPRRRAAATVAAVAAPARDRTRTNIVHSV
jgi:hypothetical protein